MNEPNPRSRPEELANPQRRKRLFSQETSSNDWTSIRMKGMRAFPQSMNWDNGHSPLIPYQRKSNIYIVKWNKMLDISKKNSLNSKEFIVLTLGFRWFRKISLNCFRQKNEFLWLVWEMEDLVYMYIFQKFWKTKQALAKNNSRYPLGWVYIVFEYEFLKKSLIKMITIVLISK